MATHRDAREAGGSAPDQVEEEVERRLEALREDPELRGRYDRNGDGEIDDEEWEAVRRMLTAEVRTEQRRRVDEAEFDEHGRLPELAEGDLLDDRFELRQKIGEGGQGFTYLAWDLSDEELVAVKELDLGQTDDWKAIELFEREGEALEQLSHPRIPSYIDAFHIESDAGQPLFFLVQEYVDGESLESMIEGGETFDEEEVGRFVDEMLETLDYIHGQSPPVVHRDIKPSNIIRRPDGTHALVDFGAVQTILPDEVGGSTVVGTSGYMPVEQLMGRSTPQTDLYALGATAVHLLSRQHPTDLPVDGMALKFRDRINVSPPFADFLEQLLQPHAEDRFPSASEARSALNSLGEPEESEEGRFAGSVPADVPTESAKTPLEMGASEGRTGLKAYRDGHPIRLPTDTDISTIRKANGIRVDIPSPGLVSGRGAKSGLRLGCLLLVMMLFLPVSCGGCFADSVGVNILSWIFGPAVLAGTLLAVRNLVDRNTRDWCLELDDTSLRLRAQAATDSERHQYSYNDIQAVEVAPDGVTLLLAEDDKTFAQDAANEEIAWLAWTIDQYRNRADSEK